MKRIVRRRLWKLKENVIRERRVEELIDANAQGLRKSFNDGLLKACDKLSGEKVGQTEWR